MRKFLKILTMSIACLFIIFSSSQSFSFILNAFYYEDGNDPNHYGGGNIAPEELESLPLGYPDYLDNCWVHRSVDKAQADAHRACLAAAGILALPPLLAACDANKTYEWPNFPKTCQDKKAKAYKDVMKNRTAYKACEVSNSEEFFKAVEQPFNKSGEKEYRKPMESKTLKYNIGWPLDWTCSTGFELRRPARFIYGKTNGEVDLEKQSNEMECNGRCGILEYKDGRYWEVIKVKFIDGGEKIKTLIHAEKEEKVDNTYSSNAKCAFYKSRETYGIQTEKTPLDCEKSTSLNYTWMKDDDPENINTFHKIRTKEMEGYMVVINKEINLKNDISLNKPLTLESSVFRHLHKTKINGNGHTIKLGDQINIDKEQAWIYNNGVHYFWFNRITFKGSQHILGSKTTPLIITNSTFITKGTAFKPWKMWILTGNTFEIEAEGPTIQFGTNDPLAWINETSLSINSIILDNWLQTNGISQYQDQSQKDFDNFISELINDPSVGDSECKDIVGAYERRECRRNAAMKKYKSHNLRDTARIVRNFISGPGIIQDYNIIANNTFKNTVGSKLLTFSGYSKGNTITGNTYQVGNNNNLETTISIETDTIFKPLVDSNHQIAANKIFNPLIAPKHIKIQGEDGLYHDALLSQGTPITATGGLTHNKIRLVVDERTKVVEFFGENSLGYKKVLTACNKSNLVDVSCDGQFFTIDESKDGKNTVDIYFSIFYDNLIFNESPLYARSLTSTTDTQGTLLEDPREKLYHFISNHETPSEFTKLDLDTSEEAWQAKHHYYDSEKEKESFTELLNILEGKSFLNILEGENLKNLVETHCNTYIAPKKIKDLENKCKYKCPSENSNSFFCKETCALDNFNEAKQAHICIVETACSLQYIPTIPSACKDFYKHQKDYKIEPGKNLTTKSYWWNYYADNYNPCIEKYCSAGDKSCTGDLVGKTEESQPSETVRRCMYTNACQNWDANRTVKSCIKPDGNECLEYYHSIKVKPIFETPFKKTISIEATCSTITDEEKAEYSFTTTSTEKTLFHSDDDCKFYEEWDSSQYKCVDLECYNGGNIENGWGIEDHECIRTSCNNPAYYIDDNDCVPCPDGKVAKDDWSGCRLDECDIDSDCPGSNYSCEYHKCELKECPEGYIAKSWGCQEIDPDEDDSDEEENNELPIETGNNIGNEDDFIVGGYVTGDNNNNGATVKTVDSKTGSGGCSLINPNEKQKTPALFLIIFLTLTLIYRKRIKT